ncbi:unnamed protein product [Prorocentrum cordatum]|uniref:Uncharacterized protein n=1 Tax=Prorocentrum cordatum TaxID=2364126 RepID=A0ABN9TWU0_9DINO|nr:unnamed protein product [Polarella glacialis]
MLIDLMFELFSFVLSSRGTGYTSASHSGMLKSLRNHWEPIFAGTAVDSAKLDSIFDSAAELGNLHLQPKKSYLIPLWAPLTEDVVQRVRRIVAFLVPQWREVRIEDKGQTGAPVDSNVRLYGTSWFTVLTYLAQFFGLPRNVVRKEFHALHKALRLPPSAFRLTDILSFDAWFPTTAVRSMQALAAGTLWHTVKFTITTWPATLQRMDAVASRSVGLPRLAAGQWSPPFWRIGTAVVQRFAAASRDRPMEAPARTLPMYWQAAEVAKRAVRLSVAAGTRPHPQRAFVKFLQAAAHPDTFDTTLRKRLATWIEHERIPHDLQQRWRQLRVFLITLPPACMRWIVMRSATTCNAIMPYTGCLALDNSFMVIFCIVSGSPEMRTPSASVRKDLGQGVGQLREATAAMCSHEHWTTGLVISVRPSLLEQLIALEEVRVTDPSPEARLVEEFCGFLAKEHGCVLKAAECAHERGSRTLTWGGVLPTDQAGAEADLDEVLELFATGVDRLGFTKVEWCKARAPTAWVESPTRYNSHVHLRAFWEDSP